MVATLLQLAQGTQTVCPTTLVNLGNVGDMFVENIDIKQNKGIMTVSAEIRSQEGNKAYATTIQLDINNVHSKKPRFSVGNALCKVRCSCKNYEFCYAHNNDTIDAHYGALPPAYQRKTTTRPSPNPYHLPGMCKHILLLAQYLQQNNIIF